MPLANIVGDYNKKTTDMKKFIVLLFVQVFIGVIAFGQEVNNKGSKDELKTIFNKPHQNGGYGGFTIGYTKINNQDALITGGRGAWIIDRSLAIGAAGYGFVTDINYLNNTNETGLAGGYGGFMLEFIIFPISPVHISIPLVIGGGAISVFENLNYWDPYTNATAFFVLMPGLEVELNVVRFFRLSAGIYYTLTSDIVLNDLSGDPVVTENVLNGFTFGLNFKFGKF